MNPIAVEVVQWVRARALNVYIESYNINYLIDSSKVVEGKVNPFQIQWIFDNLFNCA